MVPEVGLDDYARSQCWRGFRQGVAERCPQICPQISAGSPPAGAVGEASAGVDARAVEVEQDGEHLGGEVERVGKVGAQVTRGRSAMPIRATIAPSAPSLKCGADGAIGADDGLVSR
jgi:hypothetical protein